MIEHCLHALVFFFSFLFILGSVCLLQVVVTGGVLSLVMWFNSRNQLVHEIERRLTTVAVLRTEQLQDYLSGEMDKMQLIATRVQIVNYLTGQANVNESTARGDLESAVSAVSEFISAAIYSASGTLLFSTNATQFNATLALSVLQLVGSNVNFDLPIYVQGGWRYLLSRNITVVGSFTLGFFTLCMGCIGTVGLALLRISLLLCLCSDECEDSWDIACMGGRL